MFLRESSIFVEGCCSEMPGSLSLKSFMNGEVETAEVGLCSSGWLATLFPMGMLKSFACFRCCKVNLEVDAGSNSL